jgi:hypothetical protein
MSATQHGKNVTKLIIRFIAREAVPPGGGINNVAVFFSNAEHRKQIIESAEAKAIAAIQLIKNAPDNPYGDDEEIIAGILLEKIQEKQKP